MLILKGHKRQKGPKGTRILSMSSTKHSLPSESLHEDLNKNIGYHFENENDIISSHIAA
jgi:hypothetical protein